MRKITINFLLVIFLAACTSRHSTQIGNGFQNNLPEILTSTPTQKIPFPTQPVSSLTEDDVWMVGMTVAEIEYYYLQIRTGLENKSPEEIAQLIEFPIHICGRCSGPVIENTEQFVENYSELLDVVALERILGSSLDEAIIKYSGVGLGAGDIWISLLCNADKCDDATPRINKFMSYCHFSEEHLAQGYRLADPGIFSDGTTLKFGSYWVTSVDGEGNSFFTNEEIASFQSITIQKEMVDFTKLGRFAKTCEQPELEYCGPVTRKDQPRDLQLIGTLNILCDQRRIFVFDVLSGGRLGYYYSDLYFLLDLIEEEN